MLNNINRGILEFEIELFCNLMLFLKKHIDKLKKEVYIYIYIYIYILK